MKIKLERSIAVPAGEVDGFCHLSIGLSERLVCLPHHCRDQLTPTRRQLVPDPMQHHLPIS